MIVSWRRLLLCLLVLALPVQGFAAALRLGCAAAQAIAAVEAVQSAEAARAAQTAQTAQAPSPPCHQAMPAAPVDTADADDEPGPATGHKCSACAACHAQAAIDAPAAAPQRAALHGVYVAAVPAWPAGRLTETLERPPRSLLA